MDRWTVAVTKKELPVLEHRSRGCVPLISHPYDDSSAYLLRHCDPYDLLRIQESTTNHNHTGRWTDIITGGNMYTCKPVGLLAVQAVYILHRSIAVLPSNMQGY